MIIKKIIFHNIFLLFFPESEALKKHWWHKVIKIITVIITASSLYSIIWMAATFLVIPQSWFSDPLEKLFYYPAYIPLNMTNYLSQFPIYGMVFHALAYIPPFGPMTLIVILSLIYFITPPLLYRLAIYISQKFYLMRVKIILFAVLLGLGLFTCSTWKYQQLINEGSAIADEECLKVNPLIIQRKNSFINSMKILQASGSDEEYWTETNRYLDISKKFIAAQKEWLATQKNYMDRRDYNTFVPEYIRKLAQLQYDSREAEVKSTSTVVEYFETYKNLDSNQQEALMNTILDETKKSNDTSNEYEKMYNSPKSYLDLRDYFASTPQTTCPSENFDIPNVLEMLKRQVAPNSPIS